MYASPELKGVAITVTGTDGYVAPEPIPKGSIGVHWHVTIAIRTQGGCCSAKCGVCMASLEPLSLAVAATCRLASNRPTFNRKSSAPIGQNKTQIFGYSSSNRRRACRGPVFAARRWAEADEGCNFLHTWAWLRSKSSGQTISSKDMVKSRAMPGHRKRSAAQLEQLERIQYEKAANRLARAAEALKDAASRAMCGRRPQRQWIDELHLATPHEWLETEVEENVDPGRSDVLAAVREVERQTAELCGALQHIKARIVLTTRCSHKFLLWSQMSRTNVTLYKVDLSDKGTFR
jgi:hypothetical protein